METQIVHICHVCHKEEENMMWCSRCKGIKYCSRECQKINWKDHKIKCNSEAMGEVTGVKNNINEIIKNNKIMSILMSLSYFWEMENFNCVSCKIISISYKNENTKNIEKIEKVENTEKFYQCEIIPHNLNEKSYQNDRSNILFRYIVSESKIFETIVGCNKNISKNNFDMISENVNYETLTYDKNIKFIISNKNFCAFVYGDKLINIDRLFG